MYLAGVSTRRVEDVSLLQNLINSIAIDFRVLYSV